MSFVLTAGAASKIDQVLCSRVCFCRVRGVQDVYLIFRYVIFVLFSGCHFFLLCSGITVQSALVLYAVPMTCTSVNAQSFLLHESGTVFLQRS